MSRIWKGMFRIRGDDLEKRLQRITKDEAAVIARMKKRALTWGHFSTHLILFTACLEVIAVAYAITVTATTKSQELSWKMRAFRILPSILLPLFSYLSYSTLASFTKMCDSKDQKTLERLREERQAKINELKERTNYYTTQQLIQQYDPDPTTKVAAASVLASKLGTESGFKIYLDGQSQGTSPTEMSNEAEFIQSTGLRNRKDVHSGSPNSRGTMMHNCDADAMTPNMDSPHDHVVAQHYPQSSTPREGGWIARLAALLVGQDETRSYALICGNCHMHNGKEEIECLLQRVNPYGRMSSNHVMAYRDYVKFVVTFTGLVAKEDFPYITYYCPHCHSLNQPKAPFSGSTSDMSSLEAGNRGTATNNDSASPTHHTEADPSSVGVEFQLEELNEEVGLEHLPHKEE